MKEGCHKGNPLVFDTGKVKVYAGGSNRGGGWHRMKPIPNLAMGPLGIIQSAKTLDILPQAWKSSSLLLSGETPVVLEFDWPDYSIPSNLGPSYWKALVTDIEEKDIKTISCQCMGGHGRTGVQLSILAHLLMPKKQHTWKTAEELITYIRDSYCKHAVESKQQQTYIADVCGIPEGKSAITITENVWAEIEFEDNMMLTDDELREIEREEDKLAKTEKKTKGKKRKTRKTRKNVPKSIYDSPIKGGWSLTGCMTCGEYEWRRAKQEDMEMMCRKCGDTAVVSRDEELLEGHNQHMCYDTEENWHPIEMYNENTSYKAEALSRGYQVRGSGNGLNRCQVKIASQWHHCWWLTVDSDDEFVPVHKVYIAMRAAEKMFDVNDELTRPPARLLKHQTTLDTYRKSRRQTNDEIEAED